MQNLINQLLSRNPFSWKANWKKWKNKIECLHHKPSTPSPPLQSLKLLSLLPLSHFLTHLTMSYPRPTQSIEALSSSFPLCSISSPSSDSIHSPKFPSPPSPKRRKWERKNFVIVGHARFREGGRGWTMATYYHFWSVAMSKLLV